MWPVGWQALGRWDGDVARIEPLAGGVANDVWSVRVNGHLAVGRLGARSDADLAWETELLQHLDREGLTVPVPIPTTGGRLFADGLVVMTYLEGGPPETKADWRRVADALRQLHRSTQGWPQRPGWRSTTARTTSPRRRRPLGRPPSAGTTSMQSGGSPKFERSENAFEEWGCWRSGAHICRESCVTDGCRAGHLVDLQQIVDRAGPNLR